MSIVFVLFQQALIILVGLLVFDKHNETFAYVIWSLCLPLLYLNYLTVKLVFKYGIIDFITINSDTSEIDVPHSKRRR